MLDEDRGSNNLHRLWRQRDDTDHQEGLVAYIRYRGVMETFARYYGFSVEDTTSAFVALSPNNDYHGNLRSLASVLCGVKHGWHPEAMTVSTYKACRNRAVSYLTGEADFLSTVKGPKIRAFRDNILNPLTSDEVTVDGHMVGAWYGESMTMKEAAALLKSKAHYDTIARGIAALARQYEIRPCAAQAILWLTRKRILNVKYDAQLSLFQDRNDIWKTVCRPEDFPPYKTPDTEIINAGI